MPEITAILRYMEAWHPRCSTATDDDIYQVVSLSEQSDMLLPHTIYICHRSLTKDLVERPESTWFFVIDDGSGELAALHTKCVEFTGDVTPASLFRAVTAVMQQLSKLAVAKAALDTLHYRQAGLQALIDEASAYLRNPILLYGISAHMLAYSMPEILRSLPDPLLQEILENGHISNAQLLEHGMAISHRIEDYAMTDLPRVYQDQSYAGYPRMTMAVLSGGRQSGLLSVIEVLNPFPPTQREFLLHLRQILELEMSKELEAGLDQQLLEQLLQGRFPTPESFYARAVPFGWQITPYYQAIVLEPQNSHRTASYFLKFEKNLQTLLRDCFPFYRLLIHEEYVLLLTGVKSLSEADVFLQRSKHLLRSNGIVMGVSQPFTDISRLAHYLAQAQAMIVLGARRSPDNCCRFDDNSFLYLLYLLYQQNYPLREFCVPELNKVAAYDAQVHGELNATARQYLYSMGSVAAAAESLSVHRNTVTRRLDQFSQISGLSLSDSELCQRLLLSYKVADLYDAMDVTGKNTEL